MVRKENNLFWHLYWINEFFPSEFLEKVANFSSKANANRENNSFDHTHHQNSNGDSTSHHTANNDSNDSNPGKEYTPEQLEAVKRYYNLCPQCGNFRFLREINFGNSRSAKYAILNI